jgi:hypothetical protein
MLNFYLHKLATSAVTGATSVLTYVVVRHDTMVDCLMHCVAFVAINFLATMAGSSTVWHLLP